MGGEHGMRTSTDEEGPAPRRVDRIGLLLAAATVVFVGGAAWLRFRQPAIPEPPALGATLPPLGLRNLETSEPLLLVGLKGKVVWVVFWSAGSPSGKAVLPRLEDAWRRLRSNRRFTLVAAAVDSSDPDRVRAALAEAHASLPAYLATLETRRRFGAERGDPPLHLLVDADGRIAALVHGAGRDTVDRIRDQARGLLEDLDPLGPTRFAGDDAGARSPSLPPAPRPGGRASTNDASMLNGFLEPCFLDGSC